MKKRKKLVIISHTEHFIEGGVVRGWGPTINEINYLADYWEEVVHVGCLYDKPSPPSALPYTKNNISFAPIPPYGGKTIKDKILIFFKIPKIIAQVNKHIQGATEVQLRLPTAMGLYLLPFFSFFRKRKFTLWVKYAGAWDLKTAPMTYKLQRFWLKQNWQRSKVTINGFWPDQPKHCISFENPCLEESDLKIGRSIAAQKNFQPPYTLCFVGRLEEAKGVDAILEALRDIPKDKIQEVHLIGGGDMAKYRKMAASLPQSISFHSFLPKEEVHSYLSKSHFILLPSRSEGFPKVIAEAACYGVIPIVSNVGSIPHFINYSNGFIWKREGEQGFSAILNEALCNSDWDLLKSKSIKAKLVSEYFSFEHYRNKLERSIFEPLL